MMDDWGGAQWLIIFLLSVRTVLGYAAASGIVTFDDRPVSPGARNITNRILDIIFLAVLVWGGFF
ncbi:hypothetical protein [Oryzicola mucosus]|uniref:Uncharacterized protein n=1 Tax=Oryzicola mucosus TaxID=2767425 RepID=A0A8J6U3F5_9HYPH|nr:hypothetical protein [Oryzicola mucosus]MBD0416518.1 hypothetical protein [Oryzicola mucosus]